MGCIVLVLYCNISYCVHYTYNYTDRITVINSNYVLRMKFAYAKTCFAIHLSQLGKRNNFLARGVMTCKQKSDLYWFQHWFQDILSYSSLRTNIAFPDVNFNLVKFKTKYSFRNYKISSEIRKNETSLSLQRHFLSHFQDYFKSSK
jgi:hypothetical protein